MSWEDKFTSIVQETESNLARVRDRLGSSRVRSSTGRLNFNSPNRDSTRYQSLSSSMDNIPKTTTYSTPFKSSLSPSKSLIDLGGNQRHLSSPTRTHGGSLASASNSSSPALLNLLYERVEQQSEMLESVCRSVKILEKEHNTQAEMISSLQNQVVKLNERLREQGVDLETERKLEQFKREMYSHLQSLQAHNRIHDKKSSLNGDPGNLSRELQESKRLLQDDCDSLRREVDHMKTRISKIELDSNSTLADSRDSTRRLDRIDRTISILSDNQRSQSHSLESMVDDRGVRSFEIGTLRQKIDDLSKQVSEWESDSQGQKLLHGKQRSSSNPKPKDRLKHKKSTLTNGYASNTTSKKPNKTTNELDISLSDSDLDMSSAAFLAIDTDSDTDVTFQLNNNSLRVATNPEISDLSSSLSSLNSDELLGL